MAVVVVVVKTVFNGEEFSPRVVTRRLRRGGGSGGWIETSRKRLGPAQQQTGRLPHVLEFGGSIIRTQASPLLLLGELILLLLLLLQELELTLLVEIEIVWNGSGRRSVQLLLLLLPQQTLSQLHLSSLVLERSLILVMTHEQVYGRVDNGRGVLDGHQVAHRVCAGCRHVY